MAARRCSKKRDTERSPVSKLSDDLLVEIISCLPFKSTCCCKCVSTRWRDLVCHPDHRKKLPRSSLAGFIHPCYIDSCSSYIQPGYLSVSGNWCAHVDTSLSFFSRYETETLDFWVDCCNGLLLCRCRMRSNDMPIGYTVCNPATKKWVDVPATNLSRKVWSARLAFDPEISSHFHVFEFAPACVVDSNTHSSCTKAVSIYSSKTGAWTQLLVWKDPVPLCDTKGVFSMGLLYSCSYVDSVVAVDLEGNYMAIRSPHSTRGDQKLFLSQGKLHLVDNDVSKVSIWALEDSNSENWILKHNVSHFEMHSRKLSFICDVELGCNILFFHMFPCSWIDSIWPLDFFIA